MTDEHKKKTKLEETPEEIEATPEAEALAEPESISGEEYQALRQQLEEAEAKAAENLDGWQRAQAEFINYKNRVQRDRDASYFLMKGDIIKQVLPVMDDLERALQNRPKDEAVKGWADGIELIYRKLQGMLDAQGVERIEALGQPFDPNFHEAISHEPNEEVESGHVIEVIQHGYMIGERVIRPALVRVAQ